MKKNGNKDPIVKFRASPLPKFVDGKWVQNQFGPAFKKQKDIAKSLANCYGHWLGDEYDIEFFEKIAQDLSIPGFIRYLVSDVLRGECEKSPKKEPFHFMLSRFHSYIEPRSESMDINNKDLFMSILSKAVERNKDEDIRDFAFFTAIFMENPNEIMSCILNTSAHKDLVDFLIDFREKIRQKNEFLQDATLIDFKDEWQQLLNNLEKKSHSWANDTPNSNIVKEIDQDAKKIEVVANNYLEISEYVKKREYVNFCQSIADNLAPFNDKEPIKTVHAKILQQKNSSKFDEFIAENVRNEVDVLVEFLKKKNMLWSDMEKCQQEEDTQGIFVCNNKIEILKEEIETSVAKLPIIFGGAVTDSPAYQKLQDDKLPPNTPPLPPKSNNILPPVCPSEPKPAIRSKVELVPKPVQKPVSSKTNIDRVNQTVRALILLEEFDVAYHVAYCGEKLVPNGVFMFPATSLYLLAFPECAAQDCDVGKLEILLTQNNSEETKMMVFASALFPAVFYISSGTRNLYSEQGALASCDNLGALREKIASFENWSVGVDNFNFSQELPQDIIANAKKDLSNWYYAKEKKKLQFAPATRGWCNWMKKNGLLGAVIFPLIGKNPLGGLPAAKDFLSRYQDEGVIENEIDNISGKKIEGNAKKQLRNLIREGISSINTMVDALENEDKHSDKSVVLSKKCDEFLGALQQAKEMTNDSNSVGYYCLQRAFDFFEENNMHIIFSGKKYNKVPGLAKVSDVRHDYLGTPFKYSGRLLDLVEQSLRNGEFEQDKVDSCRRQVERKALLSAQLLLKNIDKSDEKYKELEHEIKQKISIFRKELKEKIDKLDKGLNIVQMPHGEKEELREKLIRIDTDNIPSLERHNGDAIADFPQAYETHDIVKASMEKIGDAKLEELKSREKISDMSDEKREAVQKMIKENNYIFAEYLLNLKEPDMPDMRLSAPHIQVFFEKGYIGKAKKDKAFNSTKNNNSNKANGVEKKRRDELLEKWNAMFSGPSDSCMNAVKKWLGKLNFTVKEDIINKSNNISDCRLFKVKTRPLDMPPVAAFGSRAKGNYLIMLVPEKVNVTAMHQALEGIIGSEACFIFYNGILAESDRIKFRQKNEESRRIAAFFDRAALMYLCLEKEEDLRRIFFDLSLPFSGINPFIKESADVPVEMFYGRQHETNSIISGDSRLVYGGRMLGKTALLHHVRKKEHRPKDNCFAFVIDLREGGVAPRLNDNPELIWDVIWEKIHSECKAESAKKNAGKKLEVWLQKNEECRLLVMIDEADVFLEKDIAVGSPNLTQFKNLMDGSDGRFKVVFAGLHNVKRYSRSANTAIARYGKPICVGPFEGGEQAAAVRLITEPFAAAGFIFENDLLPLEVANRTNFYPSLIQYLCHYWLSELRTISGGIRIITAEHIKNAFAKNDWQAHLADVFERTLDLDKRYALIAYVIALDTYKARKEGRIAQGLPIEQLLNECVYWKADGMKNISNDEFHCLLEEMAELGVLRHSEKHNWLLRSELVLLLIGDELRVESGIINLSEDEFTMDIISSDLHRRKLPNIGYAPLTARQEDVLVELSGTAKRWHCRVVLGGIAAGIGCVSSLLENIAKERKWEFRLHHGENGIGGMIRELDKFTKEVKLKKLERGVLIVKDTPWSGEWLEHIINDNATSKYPVVIVFLGDGGCIKDIDKDNNDYPDPVFLSPVSGAIVNDMLVHYSSEIKKEIKEVSASFLSPVNELSKNINSLTDENSREKWRQGIILQKNKMEFWGLPKVWEKHFFDLMELILDKEGEFNKEDMIYGWREIGGFGTFSGWTADEIFKVLERLSLITPIQEDSEATDKKSVKYRLIYPLRP